MRKEENRPGCLFLGTKNPMTEDVPFKTPAAPTPMMTRLPMTTSDDGASAPIKLPTKKRALLIVKTHFGENSW